MAKNKIQRIDQEIAKVREKIAEYQDKLKTLNAMLSGGTVPGMAAASANYNEQEDTDHEE